MPEQAIGLNRPLPNSGDGPGEASGWNPFAAFLPLPDREADRRMVNLGHHQVNSSPTLSPV